MEASSSSSSNRHELIRNAVLFLNDPKVASSSLTSRIQFLESKGLNEPEIQQALSQAAQGASSIEGSIPERPRDPAPRYGYNQATGREYGYGYGQGVMHPPEPPRRDWRDLFIMAVISGGVVYGLSVLAKKYLLPHLQPPSTTSFQDTSSSLTAQYDEASRLLTELTEQTSALQLSIQEDKERVNGVIEEVEDSLKNVKNSEEKWREEMRDIRSEVESVRELVPKLIEKHSASQSSALSDLQNELRSLKTLLLARQGQGQNQASSPQTNGTSSPSGGVSSTTAAANALLTPRGKGIPAWQLPSPSASPSASASGGSSLSGSAVLSEAEENHVDKGKEKGKEETS
ncbi:uncharacterized protein I303_107646 [Kwoniella dejecticola CBS 10117]|uniref:Peroxisomal membrane protein PEX14 n=1 Tax=Kwoniella dejecticola CBS 10117 TaxID=1296121 RepID=A0A1A5ZVB9_9TREE|nr:uncharacterized protein I303_07657 [Kwoniella dejecticola CBS 10117]OBR81747.1 hypothetical protein I303_07657 [Kwoniella dejecticola CBS 10117]